MKKIIATILCVVLIALSLSACSFDLFKKKSDNNNDSSGNNSSVNKTTTSNDAGNSDNSEDGFRNKGEEKTEVPTNADGFVDSSYAVNAYQAPADPSTVMNSVQDPSGENFRFIYDESGKIVKCYYMSNGQEVYLNYVYGIGYVQIFGFIGETLVSNEVIALPGEYNPDVGLSVYRGFYFKGYTF